MSKNPYLEGLLDWYKKRLSREGKPENITALEGAIELIEKDLEPDWNAEAKKAEEESLTERGVA